MRGVALGFAELPDLLGAIHFRILPHPRLAKHCQQHDPAIGGKPVGQTHGVAVVTETESEFA